MGVAIDPLRLFDAIVPVLGREIAADDTIRPGLLSSLPTQRPATTSDVNPMNQASR